MKTLKFKPDVFECWCSCKYNSTRGLKCKHLHAIEFTIRFGTIKNIDKLPTVESNRNLDTRMSYEKEDNDEYDF